MAMLESGDEPRVSAKSAKMNAHRNRTKLGKDKRRKHHHFEAKIFYEDGEVFARRYTDREKARAFADRQRKSPVVKLARIIQVD
jgi:hypothetical protein